MVKEIEYPFGFLFTYQDSMNYETCNQRFCLTHNSPPGLGTQQVYKQVVSIQVYQNRIYTYIKILTQQHNHSGKGSHLSWFVYAWPREQHYLEVWPCWSRCVAMGMGLRPSPQLPGNRSSTSNLQMKMQTSQLCLHHTSLEVAMLLP